MISCVSTSKWDNQIWKDFKFTLISNRKSKDNQHIGKIKSIENSKRVRNKVSQKRKKMQLKSSKRKKLSKLKSKKINSHGKTLVCSTLLRNLSPHLTFLNCSGFHNCSCSLKDAKASSTWLILLERQYFLRLFARRKRLNSRKEMKSYFNLCVWRT